MDTHFTPQELMNEISKIPRMLRGKLCVIRQGPNGPYYNCQCWQNGKNVAHYQTSVKRPFWSKNNRRLNSLGRS